MHSSLEPLTVRIHPPFAILGQESWSDTNVLEWARTASFLINQLNFLMLYIAILVAVRVS